MSCAQALSVALKEWAAVCHALETGRQIMLLRKGGIHEAAGEFELDHQEFLLFPTYVHQKLEMIKPADRAGLELRNSEPAEIKISAFASVTDIIQIKSRAQIDSLDGQHIWLAPLLDMRWNYRPENPLYILLTRVYRLVHTATIPNTLAYAGCKSWVPLEQTILTTGCRPVIDDREFERRRDDIISKLEAGSGRPA